VSKIILIFLSEISPHLATVLQSNLHETFSSEIEIRHRITDLGYAYDPKRKQYISPRVLSRLRNIKKGDSDKILAVADVDMYSPGYDFVYGEADIKAGIATLTINRLVSEKQGFQTAPGLLEQRVIREATHEVGHLFGLGHCNNSTCVMRTCTCLEEVDAANGGLCKDCAEKSRNRTHNYP
jgi:archaemetzincin